MAINQSSPSVVRGNGTAVPAPAIQDLKNKVKGEVLVKGEAPEEAYRSAISRWNGASTEEAGIVVFCESENDVSECLRYVQQWNIDLAVTCGRHSYYGSSSSKGGLVIDLAKMKKVTIDKENMTVTAQGGCHARDLEKPADAQGLSVVMGADNDTGIGGITLGGGSGYLTGQYGLICDNLLAARVALADGAVVNASKEENPDLFWAIRGCGPNFGVVTEFTYRAHNQGPVCMGVLVFTPDKLDQVLNRVEAIRERIIKDGGKGAVFTAFTTPPGMSDVSTFALIFYDGTEAEARSLIAPLFELGPVMEKLEMKRYYEITEPSPLRRGPPTHQRYACKNLALPTTVDVEAIKGLIENLKGFLEKYGPSVAPSKVFMELRSYEVSSSVPIEATAFAARKEAILLIVEAQYDDPKLDSVMRDEVRIMIERVKDCITTNSKKAGLSQDVFDGVLANANITSGSEELVGVFGKNLPKLQDLKKKYDPGFVFNKWHSIRPE